MAEWHLLVLAGLSGTAALLYLIGALISNTRTTAHTDHVGHRSFLIWWLGIAGTMLAGTAIPYGAAVVGKATPGLVWLTSISQLVCGAIALGSFVVHVHNLRTGSRTAWAWIAFGYMALLVALGSIMYQANPTGVMMGDAYVRVSYATPLLTQPLFRVLIALMLIPAMIAAVQVLVRARRMSPGPERLRLHIVSLAIIAWTLGATVAWAAAVRDSFEVQVGLRVLGIVAGSLLIWLYLPRGGMLARS